MGTGYKRLFVNGLAYPPRRASAGRLPAGIRRTFALAALLVGLALPASPDAAETALQARDGSHLVLVPAGSFPMGSDDAAPDQAPRHPVDLPAFYIGRHEVTNVQFARFLKETSRPVPEAWREAAARWGAQAPAVCVSLADAEAYCSWTGLRLPTEAEWEKAARGPEGRRFPWGEDFDAKALRSAAEGPAPVGSYPKGASPYGCLDMAGNAWEWTSSWYEPYPGTPSRSEHLGAKYRVIRGACWQLASEEFFATSYRGWSLGAVRFDTTGFRVACDAP